MNSIEDRLDTLESVVDEQQAQIEAHEETIAAQQDTIEAQRERLAAVENDGGMSLPISRRGALAAGGALGLLGLGAGTASASTPSGQVGKADRPLEALHSRTVNFAEGDGGFTKIESNGAGEFLEFTLGVYPDDLDTALRLEKQGNDIPHYPNVIGGRGHTVEDGTNNVNGVAIGGGFSHSVSDNFGTIGGGRENSVQNFSYGTISGGQNNTVSGPNSTISGGNANEIVEAPYATIAGGGGAEGTGNTVLGPHGTIGGGQQNTVLGNHATIAGGGGGGDAGNTAEGSYSSIPGGSENHAKGDYSFAAGHAATAEHDGAFVVGDSNPDEIESKKENEARFQMNVVANAFELVDEADNSTEGRLYVENGELKYEYGGMSVTIEANPNA